MTGHPCPISNRLVIGLIFFFFNDTATTEIYTLSLHDALPIYIALLSDQNGRYALVVHDKDTVELRVATVLDRKSTRLNSSHTVISYAVFCLKQNACRGVQQARDIPALLPGAGHLHDLSMHHDC